MKSIDLSDSEVQIWWTSLEANEDQLEKLRRLLSVAEQQRASRFRIRRAERRFIVARAALRLILCKMTGHDPSELEFNLGEHGKPYLTGRVPHFNASDSGDYVAIAISPTEVGIDIENSRILRRADRLARRVCTQLELDDLAKLAENERGRRILRLWTCKEAALKAVGVGLRGGARNIEVDFSQQGSPTLTNLLGDASGWTLLFPEIHSDIVCSLVIRGNDWRVVERRFSVHST